jgi:anti-sigma B factor antagonist
VPDSWFEWTVSPPVDGSVRIAITGELDVGSLEAFQTLMSSSAMAQPTVELDLADLTFIDSSGLLGLVTARQSAVADGRTFRVVAVSPQVERVLTVTALAPMFGLDEPRSVTP